MQKKWYPLAAGFTLMEIMVVCVLVGIVSSFAISNLVVNGDNVARSEALKFAGAVDYLREESALSGQQMAVGFFDPVEGSSARGYQFYFYKETWNEFSDELLGQTLLPETIRASLSTTTNSDSLIVVDPIGMVSNFTASFFGTRQRYDVKIDETLNVVVKKKLLNE